MGEEGANIILPITGIADTGGGMSVFGDSGQVNHWPSLMEASECQKRHKKFEADKIMVAIVSFQ